MDKFLICTPSIAAVTEHSQISLSHNFNDSDTIGGTRMESHASVLQDADSDVMDVDVEADSGKKANSNTKVLSNNDDLSSQASSSSDKRR